MPGSDIKGTLRTSPLVQISPPVHSSDAPIDEYPTVVVVSDDILLVSDGAGRIYAVECKQDQNPSIIASIDYIQDNTLRPLTLLAARLIGSKILFVVCAAIYNDKPKATDFDLELSEINLAEASPSFNRIHTLRTQDVPVFTEIQPNGEGYLVATDKIVTLSSGPAIPEPSTAQSEKSQAPASEAYAASAPYMWTQTSEDVTINIQLPLATPKSAINCTMNNASLSLLVKTDSEQKPPSFITEAFFDAINASTSLWTFDPEKCILSIDLEKSNEGTRWPHVFAKDDGVLETIDPSEMKAFLERLDQYTGADVGTSRSGLFDQTATSLQNELDDSIDASVGRQAIFTYITASTSPKIQLQNMEPADNVSSTAMPQNHSLVSTCPLDHSYCFKHDVDGLIYKVDWSRSDASTIFKHISTIPAFAFVLASKRDAKYAVHVSNGNDLLALIVEGSGRYMYAYWTPTDRTRGHSTNGKQAIIQLNNGDKNGNVLGVGMMDDDHGPALIIVTEKDLIVASNLF